MKKFVIIVITIFLYSIINGQLTYYQNKSVPDQQSGIIPEFSLLVEDNIQGNSVEKLLIYSFKGITIYDVSGSTADHETTLFLTSNSFGNYDKKTNEFIQNFPSFTPMVYDGNGTIYTFSVDFDLISIDILNNSFTTLANGTLISPLNHSLTKGFVRYDQADQTLYYGIEYYDAINDEHKSIIGAYETGSSYNAKLTLEGKVTDMAISPDMDRIYIGLVTPVSHHWKIVKKSGLNFSVEHDISLSLTNRPGLIMPCSINGELLMICCPLNENSLFTGCSIYILFDETSIRHKLIGSPAFMISAAEYNTSNGFFYFGHPSNDNGNNLSIYTWDDIGETLIHSSSMQTNGILYVSSNFPNDIIALDAQQMLVAQHHDIGRLINTSGSNHTYVSDHEGLYNLFHHVNVSSIDGYYVNSCIAGGFLKFSPGNDVQYTIWTGQALFDGFISPNTGRVYLFSEQYFENNRIYIYDPSGLGVPFEFMIEEAFLGCVYNSYSNHILISTRLNNNEVRVYSEDPNSLSLTLVQTLQTTSDFVGNMMITNDKVYVVSGARNGYDLYVDIFDAASYTLINSIDLTALGLGNEMHASIVSHFKKSNDILFLALGDDLSWAYDEYVLDSLPDPFGKGYMVAIKEDDSYEYIQTDVNNPVQLETSFETIPGDAAKTRAFIIPQNGQLYLTMVSYMPVSGLSVNTIAIPTPQGYGLIKAIEMEQDGTKLFVATNNSSQGYYSYLLHIYDMYSGSSTQIAAIDGKVISMKHFKEKDVLYVYAVKLDAANKQELTLYKYDLLDMSKAPDQVSLQNFNMFWDLEDQSFYRSDVIIDENSDRLYMPNGDHSNFSLIEDKFERLYLNPNHRLKSWICLPRLTMQGMHAVEALTGNIVPDLTSDDNANMLGRDPGSIAQVEIVNWVPTPGYWLPGDEPEDLTYTVSQAGYELFLDYESGGADYINLFGDRLARDATIDILWDNRENWTGYWIPEPQFPPEAFANYFGQISRIDAIDWFCVYTVPCAAKSISEHACWYCQHNARIDYGDMIKLTLFNDISNFQYNWSGNPPTSEEPLQTEYFTYDEEGDYAGLVIELDSTDNPLEMGAFVNDTCIGASVVLPDDSICLIRAYMDVATGEITFREHFDSTKSGTVNVESYTVLNQQTYIREKRRVDTREGYGTHYISFRDCTDYEPSLIPDRKTGMDCYPNPFNGSCTVDLFLATDTPVRIEVSGLTGRKMATIDDSYKMAGQYSLSWEPDRLPEGVYFIQLTTSDVVVTRKVVYAY